MARIRTRWRPSPLPLTRRRARPPVEPVQRPGWTRGPVVVLGLLGMAWALLGLRLRRVRDPLAYAAVVRRAFEALGGLWIKVGQMLATRTDAFGVPFCDAISHLQYQVPAVPFEHVARQIREDFGRPIEQLFAAFDPTPFAAASLGQLHEATLAGGERVAVKVRRPHVDVILRGDARFIGRLLRTLHRLRVARWAQWPELARELDQMLVDELDYRYEASALKKIRRNLRRHHKVHAPKPFLDRCSQRVLTMEYVQGGLLSDVIRLGQEDPAALRAWYADNGIDPRAVARNLSTSQMRQRFVDNLCHTDLHPGNIVLLRNNRIALIDFGSVGRLDAERLRLVARCQAALTTGHYALYADLYLLLIGDLPNIDVEPVRIAIMRALQAWNLRTRTPSMDFAARSASSFFRELSAIFSRHGVAMPWFLLRMNRSTITLNACVESIYPEFDYLKMSRRYHRRRTAEQRAQITRSLGRPEPAQALTQICERLHRARSIGGHRLEWARRRARRFQSVANKVAVALLAVTRLATLLLMVGLAALVAVGSHQHLGGLGVPAGLAPLLDEVPRLSRPTWAVICVAGLVLAAQVSRLRRRLAVPDIELPGGAA